jgi:hypothetical protein
MLMSCVNALYATMIAGEVPIHYFIDLFMSIFIKNSEMRTAAGTFKASGRRGPWALIKATPR